MCEFIIIILLRLETIIKSCHCRPLLLLLLLLLFLLLLRRLVLLRLLRLLLLLLLLLRLLLLKLDIGIVIDGNVVMERSSRNYPIHEALRVALLVR